MLDIFIDEYGYNNIDLVLESKFREGDGGFLTDELTSWDVCEYIEDDIF